MKRTFFALVGVLLLAAVCFAQVRPAVVRASGEATVSANPDQVKISVGVVTQAQTAQEAASQNANQVSGVITQVKQVVGSGAEIKTVTYTLSPNYTYPPNAQPINRFARCSSAITAMSSWPTSRARRSISVTAKAPAAGMVAEPKDEAVSKK